MCTAREIADVLQALCPGLSTEGMAAALGIELRPAPAARYRYLRAPARVEYDSLATPDEQARAIQRAIVVHTIEAVRGESLKLPPDAPSIIAIAGELAELLSPAAVAAKRSA